MAYAAVVTYTPRVLDGRRHLLVEVAETEGAAASEYTLALGEYLPAGVWTLERFKLVETSGTAATYAPVWGEATNPTSGTMAYLGGLVAAGSQDSTNSGVGWVGAGLKLYCRSVPNAGADNVITSRFYFREGWDN
jgi:hypothetical protein